MKHYIWILSAVMLYCLFTATYKYYFLHSGNQVFFYHELVIPFRQHAVQVSIFLFTGLIYLLRLAGTDWYLNNKTLHILLIFYFIFCIVLLSSKLVIILSAMAVVYHFIYSLKKQQDIRLITISSILTCITITVVLLTTNPVSKRFNEIISGNISLVSQPNFTPGIYFNGLQFRLLQWRFVSEILNENHAWLYGVTPGDAQTLLDRKYISTNMYLGEDNASGFLRYNTHNQFLESTLQSGILGLLSFIAICYSLIKLAVVKKSMLLSSVVILLILYGLNESYFETQYGIILFTFFPLFFYYGSLNACSKTVNA
jgi:O-antigen ligase